MPSFNPTVIVLLSTLTTATAQAQDKPNIVFILVGNVTIGEVCDMTQASMAPEPTGRTSGLSDFQEAFRDAEAPIRGETQVKDALEAEAAAAREAIRFATETYSTAMKGVLDYNSKIIEIWHNNTAAALDFSQELAAVRSPAQFFELASKYARQRFTVLTDQTTELAGLAQKVTSEATQSVATGITKAMDRVAFDVAAHHLQGGMASEVLNVTQ